MFIFLGMAGYWEMIFKEALHALDSLQSLTDTLWVGEAGGVQKSQLLFKVTHLPVQMLKFVAFLLNSLPCWHRTQMNTTFNSAVVQTSDRFNQIWQSETKMASFCTKLSIPIPLFVSRMIVLALWAA